jgi:Spy/CpxP family protein refolding chaperone
MVTRPIARRIAVAAVLAVLVPGFAMAQAAGKQAPARGARAQGPRQGLPPLGRGMNAMQLQQYLDALVLRQAQEHLKLSDDQYGTFAPKLVRLQNIRRRMLQERRKAMADLNQLLQADAANDDAISTKVRAFDDTTRRGAEELVKAFQDLDGVLTPWQRGRFRVLEEQIERQKVQLLAKLGAPAEGK